MLDRIKRLYISIAEKLFMVDGLEKRSLIYAIGDIHGRNDLLTSLIRKIENDIRSLTGTETLYEIKVIFLGDYIDRGDDSKAVIEKLMSLSDNEINFIFLMGNHEETLLSFLENSDVGALWLQHGGRETLASYGVTLKTEEGVEKPLEKLRLELREVIPQTHIKFLKDLELMHIHEPYLFVHAGIDPEVPVCEQTAKDLLWIREPFLNSEKKPPYIIVHGHSLVKEPFWNGHRIALDTGAYISGKLSGARLWKDHIYFLTT